MGDRGPQTGLQLAQLGGCSSGPSPGLRAPLPLLFGSVLCLDSIAIIIVFILCMSHSVHPLIRNMWENALCFLSVLSGARTPESWEEFQRPWLPATLLPPRQREREKSKRRGVRSFTSVLGTPVLLPTTHRVKRSRSLFTLDAHGSEVIVESTIHKGGYNSNFFCRTVGQDFRFFPHLAIPAIIHLFQNPSFRTLLLNSWSWDQYQWQHL